MQELQLAEVPVVGLRSVDIRRFGYNLTLAVFTGESRDESTANLTKIYVSDKGKDEFLVGGFFAILGRDDFLQLPLLVSSSETACIHLKHLPLNSMPCVHVISLDCVVFLLS